MMILSPDLVALQLRLVGLIMAALVVVNLLVPRRFRWRQELARLSLVNRQIFRVHGFFIVLTLVLFSALLLFCSDELLMPARLNRVVLAGMTVFWAARMLAQWFYYSPEIWRGNRLYTIAHYAFSVIWVYVTITLLAALWINLSRPVT